MELFDVGERFSEERQRLGYNQASFSRLLQINRMTLINIESGKSEFKVGLLIAAAAAGMDVQYVLTGIRSPNTSKVSETIGFDRQVIQGDINGGIGNVASGANVHYINTTKHITRTKAEVKPGVEHITEHQKVVLKELVEQVVQTEANLKRNPKTYQSVWASLNKHCGVTTYKLIRCEDFEKARKFLNMWLGRLNSSKSAPLQNSDEWRKKKISYIKLNTQSPEDEAAMRAYIKRNFSVTSITELANDELERTYRYVAGRKNRSR